MKTLEERFWAKVDKSGDCWLWKGAAGPNGYGRFKAGKRTVYAHRFSAELEHGALAANVLHRCDVRACVNPEHLFLGTQGDNVADMEAKGRARKARGSKNGRSKLSEAQARDALRRLEAGEGYAQIADDLGVHPDTIRSIRDGRSWKWLARDEA